MNLPTLPNLSEVKLPRTKISTFREVSALIEKAKRDHEDFLKRVE